MVAGQRVDFSRVASRQLCCLICKGKIERGETYSASGTANADGDVEYFVNLHAACLSLLNASLRSHLDQIAA